MIGNDMALDTGVGVCGKDGQSVPVGVGQPTLRIDRLTVGVRHEPWYMAAALSSRNFFFAYFWFSHRPADGEASA